MPKDLKIGIILGLVLVTGLAFMLSTRRSLSVKSRMLETQQLQSSPDGDRPAFIGKSPSKPASPVRTNVEAKPVSKPIIVKPPVETKTKKIHVVESGDTLSNIADRYYGDSNKWKKVLNANPAIKNPDVLVPGMRLVIPE